MLFLQVAVDGIWKACPDTGGPVQFPGFNGNFIDKIDKNFITYLQIFFCRFQAFSCVCCLQPQVS